MPTATTETRDRTLAQLLLLVLAVIVLGPVLAMTLGFPAMGMMGWGWHDAGTVGMAPWWGLGMGLVWLVVLVGGGYLLYRGLAASQTSGARSDAALEELRVAYARGDLTDEEFETRRAVLTEDRSIEQ